MGWKFNKENFLIRDNGIRILAGSSNPWDSMALYFERVEERRKEFIVSQGKDLYHKARIFLIQFCLKMLADVLKELNNLNKKFQEDNVDVTSLGIAIDHALSTLKRYFCRPDTIAEGVVHLTKFMKDYKYGFL